jgi:hypothetical protein
MDNQHSPHLFLLAHQDDEFGVFWQLYKLIKHGEKVVIVYLTSGDLNGKPSDKRDNESIRVLSDLGVPVENIYFLGRDLQVPDGKLVEYLSPAYQGLLDLIKLIDIPKHFYLLAWEGGHQDHDAAHLLGTILAQQFNRLDQSYQFPLYTGERLPWVLFKLFVPLMANGIVSRELIPWHLRGKFISYCFYYHSQKKTWLCLSPFFLFNYLFFGFQLLQKIQLTRVLEIPHQGVLLYERRGFYHYIKFKQRALDFIKSTCKELIE